VALARRARSLGLAVLASPAGATARRSVSATVLDAVRRAVDGGPSEAALGTLSLARELGIDPDLDRAQELVYDALRAGHRPDLAGLAEALGLSPALFGTRPEEEVRTSA
jgi:hypothetical protein